MVLRRRKRQDRVAIRDHDEAGFFAVEKFLDDDARAGIAKLVAFEHVGGRGFGFLERLRHDDAFAGRQAIGLDDDRRALITNVGQRLVEVGEILVVGRRDVVAGEEILREGLRAFELGRGRGRAEAGQVGFYKTVDDARNERRLGADDGQVDGFILGECEQGIDVVRADVDIAAFRLGSGAGVTGRDQHLCHVIRLAAFPRQRMLPATRSDDEYLHVYRYYLYAGPGEMFDRSTAQRSEP